MTKEYAAHNEPQQDTPEYLIQLRALCEEGAHVAPQQLLALGQHLGQFFDDHAIEVESPLPPHHQAHRYCEVQGDGYTWRLQAAGGEVHITRRISDQWNAQASLTVPICPEVPHPHEAVFQAFEKSPETKQIQHVRFHGDELEMAQGFYVPLAAELIRPFLTTTTRES